MKQTLSLITLLFLLIMPALAQDESSVCASPFVRGDDSVLTINDTQVTPELFANRIRFEHAYNVIKYEIRLTQINETAETLSLDPAPLIASDPQIRQITAETANPVQLANRILGDLASDAVVWDYADTHEIAISADELSATIDTFFGIDEQSPQERDTILNNFTQRILTDGTNPSELTTFFCRQALYDRVQEQVVTETGTTLYANVDHILVSSEEVALDIIILIENGEDFATLASELTLDVATAETGGALGWQAVLLFGDSAFADAIIAGEPGTILSPVQSRFGWHVIRVNDKEDRPVEDAEAEQILDAQFTRWREDQLGDATISINPDWQSFIPQL